MKDVNNSFVLGLKDNQKIYDNSYNHVLLFAPTGTGKGVASIVQNLFNWTESVIVNDFRGENFELTSGYRQKTLKQKIFLLDFMNSEKSCCYNPLDIVKNNKDNAIFEIENILCYLVDKNNVLYEDVKNLITAIILYLLDKNLTLTFGNVLNILQKLDLLEFLLSLLSLKDLNITTLNYINSFCKKTEIEQIKIKDLALSSLKLWTNPNIDNTTSKSDFSVFDFSVNKSSLYIKIEPYEFEIIKPLLQIFYSQFMKSMVSYKEEVKTGTLIILDEFVHMGKMDFILNSISYLRGYNIKLLITLENFDSLKETYNELEISKLLSNCPIKIAFRTDNKNTLDLFTELYGSNDIFTSISTDEIRTLTKYEEIIVYDSNYSQKCQKARYFEEEGINEKMLGEAEI